LKQPIAIAILSPKGDHMSIRSGVVKICLACNKEFYVPQYRKETAKFCSHECQNHKQYDKWVFNCLGCGKECISSPSRRNYNKKFCSLECRETKRKSEKERRNHQKSINKIKRGIDQGRTFRRHIFQLKDKKCQECGYDEHDFCLDVHHIDKDCKNNNIENIAILCVICHRKLHKGFLTLKERKVVMKIKKKEEKKEVKMPVKGKMADSEKEAHLNKKKK